MLAFGPYCLDIDRRLLLRNSEPIQLQQKALEILIVLVQRRGEVVSKDALMKVVWPDAFVEEANLTQHVFMLRKMLGEGAKENRYIATVPGRGYSFVATIQELDKETTTPGILPQETTHTGKIRTDVIGWRSWLAALTISRGTVFVALSAVVIAILVLAGMLPRIARYYNNKGVYVEQTGNIKPAIADFQWALRLRPGYAEAHYNLANAYEDIFDYDKALEQYQQAINADPKLYAAYNNLARLYIMRRRDCESALRLLDRGMNLNPEETSVQYTLYKNYGWASFCLEQLSQAAHYLRIAQRLDTSRGAAHCLLAQVLDAQKKNEEAKAEWDTCLAYSDQEEVEPDWRIKAQGKHLSKLQ